MKIYRSQESGTSLVEASILLPLAFLFVGFLIDLTFCIFHYALLHHAANTTVRQAALDSDGEVSAAGLEQRAKTLATDYLTDSFNFSAQDYTMQSRMVSGSDGRCRVEINATRHHRCIFCQVFNTSIDLSTTASWVVEDVCYTGGC